MLPRNNDVFKALHFMSQLETSGFFSGRQNSNFQLNTKHFCHVVFVSVELGMQCAIPTPHNTRILDLVDAERKCYMEY